MTGVRNYLIFCGDWGTQFTPFIELFPMTGVRNNLLGYAIILFSPVTGVRNYSDSPDPRPAGLGYGINPLGYTIYLFSPVAGELN